MKLGDIKVENLLWAVAICAIAKAIGWVWMLVIAVFLLIASAIIIGIQKLLEIRAEAKEAYVSPQQQAKDAITSSVNTETLIWLVLLATAGFVIYGVYSLASTYFDYIKEPLSYLVLAGLIGGMVYVIAVPFYDFGMFIYKKVKKA